MKGFCFSTLLHGSLLCHNIVKYMSNRPTKVLVVNRDTMKLYQMTSAEKAILTKLHEEKCAKTTTKGNDKMAEKRYEMTRFCGRKGKNRTKNMHFKLISF